MNQKQKKALYESIMKSVAKTLKKELNEAYDKYTRTYHRSSKANTMDNLLIKRAIKDVPSFKGLSPRQVLVRASSVDYPESVTINQMDLVDGVHTAFIFKLCDANGIWHNYALTDVQLMNVAAEMDKKHNRVVVNSTNSRPGLYRFTCNELLKYEF